MKQIVIGCASAGVLTATLVASQVLASESLVQPNDRFCSKTTSAWNNASLGYTCYFFGVSAGISADVASLSATDPKTGAKGLIADLSKAVGSHAGYNRPYAYAVGIDGNGAEMNASCRTAKDRSTAEGDTVGDGTGCEAAVKHRLYAVMPHMIIR